jgi:hypothetical protein
MAILKMTFQNSIIQNSWQVKEWLQSEVKKVA